MATGDVRGFRSFLRGEASEKPAFISAVDVFGVVATEGAVLEQQETRRESKRKLDELRRTEPWDEQEDCWDALHERADDSKTETETETETETDAARAGKGRVAGAPAHAAKRPKTQASSRGRVECRRVTEEEAEEISDAQALALQRERADETPAAATGQIDRGDRVQYACDFVALGVRRWGTVRASAKKRPSQADEQGTTRSSTKQQQPRVEDLRVASMGYMIEQEQNRPEFPSLKYEMATRLAGSFVRSTQKLATHKEMLDAASKRGPFAHRDPALHSTALVAAMQHFVAPESDTGRSRARVRKPTDVTQEQWEAICAKGRPQRTETNEAGRVQMAADTSGSVVKEMRARYEAEQERFFAPSRAHAKRGSCSAS
tara:strand:- start:649 stop:1773 length:1125 start_codon:yes stop_codon:yes gene_type:complete